MNLQFVAADETDIPVVIELTKHLIDTYEDIASVPYEEILEWVEYKIGRCISEHQCVLLDGQKCGYYYLLDDGELDLIYILPAFQNRGIGSEILKKCIAESKNPLRLYVFTRNVRAISLYERFGFTIRERVGKTRLIMARNG